MEINNIQIRLNSIYPEIKGANNNPQTVGILKDLLSSRDGELVGIMQYIYQSRLASKVESEVSQLLEEIAVVEMEHMELLMDAIIAFGGTPKYDNSRGQMFNAGYINYTDKLKSMLEANIAGEERAIADYSRAQKMVENQSLKDLLNRIIEDEKLHLNAFKTIYKTVKFLSI